MKNKKSILDEARENFPEADSDLAALDKLAADTWDKLEFCQDKSSDEYEKLAIKYHLVREAYKEEFNKTIQNSSEMKL